MHIVLCLKQHHHLHIYVYMFFQNILKPLFIKNLIVFYDNSIFFFTHFCIFRCIRSLFIQNFDWFLLLNLLRYMVSIQYCVFWKILKYSGLLPFSVSPGVSVRKHTRQVEHQHCSRTGRVQKNHNILWKNKIFNEHPVCKLSSFRIDYRCHMHPALVSSSFSRTIPLLTL